MEKSAFSLTGAEKSPGLLLWQTTLTWQRLIREALDPYEISHPQFVILAILLWFSEKNMESSQVMIVNWSKLDKMTVSQSLKKLERRGLVKRHEHAVDTRAKSAHLTEEGKDLIFTLVPLVEEVDGTFFGGLPRKDQLSLIQMLGTLVRENASPHAPESSLPTHKP